MKSLIIKAKQLVKINLRFKLVSLFLSLFVIVGISFLIRFFVLNTDTSQKEILGNFLGFKVSFNKGIYFSNFSDNTLLTYLLQSSFSVLVLIFLFLINDKWLIVLLSLIFSGGMANIIDRSVDDYLILDQTMHTDTVVDYLQFTFIKNSAIFNFQDVIIVTSWVGFIVKLTINFIRNKIKESKHENNSI